jgi:hypothetical protein
MCDACREAGTRYMKRRRLRIQNGEQLTVPRIGAQRRIQALMTLGWTGTDIARACGWLDRSSVLQILRPPNRGWNDRGILRATHDAIAAAYDAMSMTPPEHMTPARSRVRNMALRRGYPVPMAWDDPDRDEHPHGVTPRSRPGRPEVLHAILEDFDWLTSAGESPEKAAERVGVTLSTIRDYRLRAARREMERAS